MKLPGLLPLLFASSVLGGEITLYDGGENVSPTEMGWSLLPPLISLPPINIDATEMVLPNGVILDTTPDQSDMVGYGANSIQPSLLLDHREGFTLKWRSRLIEEHHVSTDRAGFSVLVVCADLMALEIGMWTNEVWVQDGPPNLFTHAEGAALNTPAFVNYEAAFLDGRYVLRANGNEVLSGDLRDYRSFDHVAAGLPVDPYEVPNSIFFGDNTSSASARFEIEDISLETPDPLVFDDSGAVNDYTLQLNAAGDMVLLLDRLGQVLRAEPLSRVSAVVINGGAGDDTLTVDLANGPPIPAGGLTFNGGAEVTGDTLVLVNGSATLAGHQAINGSSGRIDWDGRVITYTGLEPVDMTGSTAQDLFFNFPATDDNIELRALGATSNRLVSADAAPSFESTDFVRPSRFLNIDGGDGIDTVYVVDDFVNGRHNVTTETFITTGNFQYNNARVTVDELYVNPSNTLATETFTVGNGGVLEVSGDVQLGGSTNSDFKGNINQVGTAQVVIGGDLIYGGAAGSEGGTYTVTDGNLVISGAVVETAANVDAAQFLYNGGSFSVGGDITVQRFSVGESGISDVHYDVPSNKVLRTTGTLAVGHLGRGLMTYSNEGAVVETSNVMIGQGAGGNGTLTIDQGRVLDVEQYLRVGNNSTGTLNLVSGTIDIAGSSGNPRGFRMAETGISSGTLILGQAGGSGTNDPVLRAQGGNFETAGLGVGRVVMHHGLIEQQSNNFIVGQGAGSDAAIRMHDGRIHTTGSLRIGNTGTGLFEQVSGEVIVGSILDLGNVAGGAGRYELYGGSLTSFNGLVVGNLSEGEFNLHGGRYDVGTSMIVGNDSGSDGLFIITNGVLNVGARATSAFTVGHKSTGAFNLHGGLVDVAGNLNVGNLAGGDGLVTMTGGALMVGSAGAGGMNVGIASAGTFHLHGGLVDVAAGLTIGGGDGGQGLFHMTNGILNVGTALGSHFIIGNRNTNATAATVHLLGGAINVSRAIRLADNGSSSSGTLVVGTADGSLSPLINLQTGTGGGNFEVADNGSGSFTFHSGRITLNSSNFITGQSVGSDATMVIGGGAVEARLDLTGGDGLRDWNTNSGHGDVTVLRNGVIEVGRNLSLGNNTNAPNSGLELTINGGVVRLGANGTDPGTIAFRVGGPKDRISLMDGMLISNGGNLDFSNAGGTALEFSGGILANFAQIQNGGLIQQGGLLRIGDTNLIRTMTIGSSSNFTQQAGILEIDIAGAGGPGVSNGHDRIIVTGDATLSGALQVVSTYAAGVGETFVILQQNGLNPVNGTFAGLAEGATLTAGPSSYRISYVGLSGNDVVLTAIETVPELVAKIPVPESGGDIRLLFQGLPDTSYTIQFADNTVPPPYVWQDVVTVVSESDGSIELVHTPLTNSEIYRAGR